MPSEFLAYSADPIPEPHFVEQRLTANLDDDRSEHRNELLLFILRNETARRLRREQRES